MHDGTEPHMTQNEDRPRRPKGIYMVPNMITLAALFGAVPLMLASGSGAELRQPLGLVLVGGLLLSQLLTLFTTPVIYLFFDRLGSRFGRKSASAQEAAL